MSAFKRQCKKVVEMLPFAWQKHIYLFWHTLRQPISFRNSTILTDQLTFTPEEQSLKIVGFLKIHNEMKHGNLERVLKHLQEICDDIVVCDCESSDASRNYAGEYTSHILSADNDFKNEIATKQKMLEYTLNLNPDWIVWLDADEVFERNGELGGIRKLCALGNRDGIDGFEFPEINLWKTKKHYRVDEFWAKGSYVRLWKNTGALRFSEGLGLHQNQYPEGMENIQKSDIAVIHYGFSSPEIIIEKYERYKKEGQSGFALERLSLDGSRVKLVDFDIDKVPLSALRVVVVALIYQSTGYADFVYRSFQKHNEGAEFMFVANDATDKMKQYLREHDLPHVIFENEDKTEYYLNRVYRAWNYGGMNVDADVIVFVNSDMAFSKGWLKNLLKNLSKDRIICSRLVESGKMLSGQYGISKDFGKTYKEYDENGFETFAIQTSESKIKKGGLFMPCMIYKETFVKSRGYPIGNRMESDGNETSGDYILFYEILEPMGVEHYTAFDSMVYHVQEGEMDD